MKKILLFCAFLFSLSILKTNAQVTTATDFTANDCNGNSHHLFADLDSGKVVVAVFVMPCASCIGPALTAYNIAQSYASSHPGKVEYFISDDLANTACSVISGWAANNNIGPNFSAFSTSSFIETDYGNEAMPKVVVLGGTDHHVYFSADNGAAGNSTAIQNAINSALGLNGISGPASLQLHLNIFPNPSTSLLTVSYSLVQPQDLIIQVLNPLGEVVKYEAVEKQNAGSHNIQFNIADIANGIYYVKIISQGNSQSKSFAVVK